MMKFLKVLPLLALVSCERCTEPVVEPSRPEGPSIALNDIVMYEVFVRNYSASGSFDGLRADLDRVQALGVNCVWLMPIHPVGELNANGSWGSPYAVADHFDVNADMGTLDNFKALVDAFHERGMAVIIDWVANHTAWDHPWLEEHPEWYTTNASGQITHPPGTNWTDVADLNYNSGAMRSEMLAALRFWVDEVGVDGFRFDYAEGVPADFWTDMHAQFTDQPSLILLAEGEAEWLHTDAGFDLSYSWTGMTALKQVLIEDQTCYRIGEAYLTENAWLPAGHRRLRFSSNHDETSWEAPAPVMYGGLAQARVAQACSSFLPGVPMFYNGQEVGSSQYLNLFERYPIDWSTHPSMAAWYSTFYNARATHPALRRGDVTIRWHADVFIADRTTTDGRRAVIVANVRDASTTADLSMYGSSMDGLTDAVTGSAFASSVALGPYEVKLYLD